MMPSPPVDLLRNEYLSLTLEQGGRIVRMQRTAKAFPTPEDMSRIYVDVLRILDKISKAGRGMLLDARAPMGRNAPEFESVMNDFRAKALPGFARIAVLVQSTLGKLQSQRYSRIDGISRLVTDDEAQAVQYLLEAATEKTKRL